MPACTRPSAAPRRVQMSRQRPWRSEHPDAVIVDRRTKWGNPYRLGDKSTGLVCYPGAVTGAEWEWESRISAPGMEHDYYHPGGRVTRCTIAWMTAEQAVTLYREALTGQTEHIREPRWARVGPREKPVTVADVRWHLAGRDLACWCPLDQPCHADVLLEIANGGAA